MLVICYLFAFRLFILSVCGAVLDDNHHSHTHHSGCGTPDPSPREFKSLQIRAERYKVKHKLRTNKRLCIRCINVNVVFHVIEDSLQVSQTSMHASDENIAYQMETLNQHFSQTPFRFSHIKTTRTVNDEWVYGDVYYMTGSGTGDSTDLAKIITTSLREGGGDTANVIIADGGPSGCVANFATMPYRYGMFPVGTYTKYDSIFLCAVSLATFQKPSTTLTHEMGHWLGLIHTFSGNSCLVSNLNDLVSDTPQQSGPTGWCSECCENDWDTCPTLPGKDPVKNFMDYSPCSSEFTPGQVQRMYDEFNEFRRRIEPCGKDETDVQLEIRLGDYPEGTSLEYIPWGSKVWIKYRLINIESHIDFTNKVLKQNLCIPSQTVHEFKVSDTNLLKEPSYLKIKMNKQTLVTLKNIGSQSISTFLSGDTSSCSRQESRFRLEILFDDYPNYVTWDVRKTKDNSLIVNQSATQGYNAGTYWAYFVRSKLFFDKCLPVGNYIFTIRDGYPYFSGSPSYFIVYKDGKQIRRGGANGGKAIETVRFSVTK